MRKSIAEIMTEGSFTNQPALSGGNNTHRESEESRRLFERWESADNALRKLEEIRDAHEPKPTDDEWHPLFKLAIQAIPYARRRADQCWLDYMEAR